MAKEEDPKTETQEAPAQAAPQEEKESAPSKVPQGLQGGSEASKEKEPDAIAEQAEFQPRSSDKKASVAAKVLKRKLDPELQKQLAEEQLDYEAPDEAQEMVQKSSLQDRERIKRKKKFRNAILLLIVPIIGFAVHWLFKPFESDIRFGFCRVFLELYVQYPDMLVLSHVEEKRDFVRIWYVQYDAFGQERMQNMQCHHAFDENGSYYISKILVDRREIDPERVAKFNTSLTTILAHPPDLTYPRRIQDALGNINIQTFLFRKPIL